MAERICSRRGCKKKHRGRGLCASHLAKAHREGNLPPLQLTLDAAARHSLTNVDKVERTADCSICGPCTAIRVRDDKRRPVECTGAQRSRKDRDPQRKTRERGYWLERAYSLTLPEYEGMLRDQKGRCAICGIEPERFDVDHDHVTGKVRGLLCSPCNRGLGQFRDRLPVVLAAAAHLEAHSSVD
ncbi:endonuclease VII domain-containing protein [Streptomyces sp. NPDC059697]|uniref:endonuclease VII domain-containing protein n=1 Tax=Streptomyces sp. NPDC059697 TaxID=3346912 RepID=UPI00369B5768